MKKKLAVLTVLVLIICIITNVFSDKHDIDASFRKIYSIAYAYPEGLSGGDGMKLNTVSSLQSENNAFTVQSRQATGRYGYLDLAKRSNPTARQALYDLLSADALQIHGENVDVGPVDINGTMYYILQIHSLEDIGLSTQEALEVWVTFRNDHPEYYWLSNECMVAENDKTFCMIVYEEYATAQSRTECNSVIESEIAKYIALADNYNTKLEMALAVHDEICKNVTYATGLTSQDEPYAHNIMGVFENKSAVCDGYAKAYQYILNELGIENIYVTGKAKTESGSEEHAWNMVKLDDGKWYNVDVTWDDTSNVDKTVYYYFGATSAVFNRTHTANTQTSEDPLYFLYEIPQVSDTPCSLVTLYEDGVKIAVCYSIENAFARMTNTNANYIVELFANTQVFAIGNKTPNVKNLTIKGNYTDTCDNIYIVGESLEVNSDIVLENAELTYDSQVAIPTKIDVGDNRITFSGEKAQCNIAITGSDKCVVEILTNKKVTFGGIDVKNIVLSAKNVNFGTAECTAENLTVKDGVTDITSEMLSAFKKVKTVNIPKSVTFISSKAFDKNTLLSNITVDTNNTAYKSADGILYGITKSGLKLVRCPINKSSDTLSVLNIVSVEENAFKSVNGVSTVMIRHGCLTIRDNAFAQISNVMSLYIPSSVATISSNAFNNSDNLTVYCKEGSPAADITTVNKQFIEEYTYTFYDYDNMVLHSVTDYENSVVLLPDAPQRDSDKMYNYTFEKWKNYTQGMLLDDNYEFIAEYKETLRKYTVKFLDAQGRKFLSSKVDAGSLVQLPKTPPSKSPTDELEYTFDKWQGYEKDENGEMKVFEDLTFIPVFNESPRKYNYTFYDDDGETVCDSGILEYGDVIPLPSEPTKPHFVFDSWLGYTENMVIKKDITFVASYNPQVYEYVFYDEDGETVLAQGKLDYSSVIPLPDEPESKIGPNGDIYVFSRWIGYEYRMQIFENTYFVAEYKVNAYKYRFLDYDGITVIEEGVLERGEVIPLPSMDPVRQSTVQYNYVFEKWQGYEEGMTISDKVDFIAQYTETLRNYECIFRDENGNTLKSEKLPYGTVIVPPEYTVNDEEDYICEFIGWNGYTEGMKLESNRIFDAKVKKTPLVCKVTFKNFDGTIFYESDVALGNTVILPATEPKRAGYKFVGWQGYTEGMTVDDNIIFVPIFELSEKDVLSDVYDIADGMIYKIEHCTTVAKFKENLNNEFIVKIYDKNNTEITDEQKYIATFCTVRLYSDEGNMLRELTVVVRGDINGDGMVTVTDFVKIKSQLISDDYLTDKVQLLAADYNFDGNVSITDFVQIKTVCLNG